MAKSYGSKELIKFVKKLGFRYQRSNSSHDIYLPPEDLDIPEGGRPYFPIQVNRKTYGKNSASRYKQELRRLGISKKTIEENL